jgi:hypothetical protein
MHSNLFQMIVYSWITILHLKFYLKITTKQPGFDMNRRSFLQRLSLLGLTAPYVDRLLAQDTLGVRAVTGKPEHSDLFLS